MPYTRFAPPMGFSFPPVPSVLCFLFAAGVTPFCLPSLARAAGLKTAIITGRRSPMVERRAEDLHIDYVMQNTSDKLAAFSQLCRDLGISMGEAAYMGDDLNDLAVVAKAGCGASPADGCAEVREAASFVSAYAGGHGALREWVEYILKQQHQWDSVLSRYMSGMAAVIQ